MGMNGDAARDVLRHFALPGEATDVAPFSGGHINDSYLVTASAAGAARRYLLQRINSDVFRDPRAVMSNMSRVIDHIRARLSSAADIARRVLTLVRTRDGQIAHQSREAGCWRLVEFIEDSVTHESVTSPADAYQAGAAFGRFQRQLADFPPPPLLETIPDFHHTPRRFDALEAAIRRDEAGRVREVGPEIAFARARRADADVLLSLHAAGEIPRRVTHNDAKLSNVLLDSRTGEALCVVDLDTVMPGLALYDFGDMMRSMTSRAAEDATDAAEVDVQLDLFEGLARGFIEEAGACLSPAERAHLVFSGRLITLEQGVRFLSDYLDGDRYYKTQRPRQNLDRTRAQFALVGSLMRVEPELKRIVASLLR
ncbi:MAG: N-acetylhexosamine 1-kinase [Phycisphaerae bacterium]|nr:N-acetylhexosamine 1-kinase [Phycisphaerae bacterium]